MKIAILGAGSIGSLIAAILASSKLAQLETWDLELETLL